MRGFRERGAVNGRPIFMRKIHEKDGVIRLDRFILRAGKGFMPMPQRYWRRTERGFAASGGTTAVCIRVVAGNGRGISRHEVHLQRRKAVAGEMTKPRLDHHRVFRQDLGLMGRKGAIY